MTTEPTSPDDRTARLEALRQRRTTTRSVPAAGRDEPATATARPRRRRRHTATGGRILAGGLSAAAALGLMGAMAGTPGESTDTPAVATASNAVPTVIVIRRTDGATGLASPTAPAVAPTAAAPVTTSRGS